CSSDLPAPACGELTTEIPGHENTQPAPLALAADHNGGPVSGRRSFLVAIPLKSLDLNGGACFLELLLDALGLVLGHAFLDGAGNALDEILRLLQAQPSDRTDDLDDRDLVVPERRHDNIELGLFLGGRSGLAACARSRGHGDRRRGGYAPLLLEGLHEFDHFHDRFVAQRLDQFFVGQCHFESPSLQSMCYLTRRKWCLTPFSAALFSQAACSLRACSTRASCAPGSASVRTSCDSGACRTPSSIDRASSSVGSDASRSRSFAP